MLDILLPFESILASPAAERTAMSLIHFLWQGAAVAAAVALINSRFPARPQVRYRVCLIGLAAMACCPPATYFCASAAGPVKRRRLVRRCAGASRLAGLATRRTGVRRGRGGVAIIDGRRRLDVAQPRIFLLAVGRLAGRGEPAFASAGGRRRGRLAASPQRPSGG